MIKYPTVDGIIRANGEILLSIKVKKADRSEVLNRSKIVTIVKKVKTLKGDVYDKASFLLINLIRQHLFASGNRRTAIAVTNSFLDMNGYQSCFGDNDYNILKGVREGYYKDEEIREWIKTGSIRRFERR